ncbi:MAG: uracil-DNA glycosylase [Candidatus Dojkabacteria bacterium]|nr:MAG: uracil-DNA glycosylase [Candidatus Dojkabacteria bacterium]
MTEAEKELRYNALKTIRDGLVKASNAPLFKYRTENKYFPVIGEGAHDAKIMFVGEAPGETEAKTGRPFCGAAGKFLDVMLDSIGMDRTTVYITNLVKDRPPGNRDPLPEEIAYYSPLLLEQIEIIKPRSIVTLGRYSMAFLMNHFGLGNQLQSISKIHGQVFHVKDRDMAIVTLYHPAVALYNGGMRETLLKDFAVLKQFLGDEFPEELFEKSSVVSAQSDDEDAPSGPVALDLPKKELLPEQTTLF